MAWTLIQQSAAETNSATGTVTPTLPGGSAAGNLLVACLGSAAGATPFTGPAGWVTGPTVANGAGNRSEIWYYPNNPGGISSAAFTSGAGQVRGNLSEFHNDAGTGVTLDASGTGTAGAVTTCTATATGANLAGDLSIAAYHWHQTVAATLTWTDPAGFTVIADDTASTLNHGYGAYQLNTAAGTLAPQITVNNAATTWTGVVAAFTGSAVAAGASQALPGQTWLRAFHHKQQVPSPASVVTAVVSGPPVYPLGHPVQARQLPQRGGATSSRRGVFAQAGPPVYPPHGPVKAQPATPVLTGRSAHRTGVFGQLGPPVRPLPGPVAAKGRGLPPRGRTASRAGTFAQLGPPVTPPHGPVQAKPPLTRSLGRATSRSGTFTSVAVVSGPPIYPLGHPVQARRLPQRGGSTQSRAGTFTAGAPQAGPPVYPLGRPVRARPPLPPRGRVVRAAGTYAGTGPAVKSLQGPVSAARRPLPPRGRTASQRGPYGQTGPPVVPLRRPVRGQPQRPLLTGRTSSRAGTFTAPIVAPFTVGALSARDAPGSVLTAAGAASILTASTAPSSAITAADAPAAVTAAYEATYRGTYGAPGGTLTATDSRTGGPG